ncbi:hypothetical protein B0T22DRAFT_156948 [Podospora appendiculata]|uniref:rRNA-processing protein FYV7 n=1 Tax=Podospora appendiculata TaxID=314037 RepID=A0AAE0XAA7_9PEZI|nr:hypothetical protein B0T22DRAFT_156948 [Podospora appendiculata]
MAAKRAREDEAQGGGGGGGAEKSTKKPRHGFKVGPDNLPDGTWRRKVIKIKENLIVQAKVKKQYAKVKAGLEKQQQEQEQAKTSTATTDDNAAADNNAAAAPQPEAPPQIHPARQAMLDDPNAPTQQLPPQRAARIVGPPAAFSNESNANATKPLAEGESPPPTLPATQEDEYRNAMDLKRGKTARNREKAQRRPGYFDKQLAEAEAKKAELDARLAEVARREAEKTKRIEDRDKYRKAMAKARVPGRDGKRKVGREGNLLLDKVKRIVGA